MSLHLSLAAPVADARRQLPAVLLVLPLVLLSWAPNPLFGQQDTTVSLERGDRVRVWSAEDQWEGRELDFRQWAGDTLVLMEPDTISVSRLSKRNIEQFKIRRADGSHLWDGFLIGGGVGLVADAVWSTALCSSIDYGIHVPCVPTAPLILSVVTVLPGAIAGSLIGAHFENYQWISVDLGPAAKIERGAGNIGVSIRVRFQPPPFP